ncbi:MoxR family ATPase, partial [Pseudomonas sp. 2995-1]|uniref:AAA family ATPase n=1 Tax=Pseudomonas sp. 2995-1 TaxID=1712679 RepID=UPI00117A3B51
DGEIYPLPEPFFVMATQNPIEFEGTYLLPEAQLDRFMMKFNINYPSIAEEGNILKNQLDNPLERLEVVADVTTLQKIQEETQNVYVSDSVVNYVLEIATHTRNHEHIFLGISPRGTLALMKAVKALSYYEGRDFVTPDDIKNLIPYVFYHRI